MRRLIAVPLTAALLGVGCSSAAGPGADDVLDQVDKAKQVGAEVEERNAEVEAQP